MLGIIFECVEKIFVCVLDSVGIFEYEEKHLNMLENILISWKIFECLGKYWKEWENI